MLMIIDYSLSTLASRFQFARTSYRKALYISSRPSSSPPLSLSLSPSPPLSRIAYLYTHEYVFADWVWNFNALVTYSTNTTERTRWRRDKAIVILCTLNNRVASYASIKHPIGVKGVAQKLNPIRLANKQSYIAQKAEYDRTREIVLAVGGHIDANLSRVLRRLRIHIRARYNFLRPRENIGAPRRRYRGLAVTSGVTINKLSIADRKIIWGNH